MYNEEKMKGQNYIALLLTSINWMNGQTKPEQWDTTSELRKIAKIHNGEYDGWETSIEKE